MRPTCPAASRASRLFATRVSGPGSAPYMRGGGDGAVAARGTPLSNLFPNPDSYPAAPPRAMRVAEAAAGGEEAWEREYMLA